MPDLKISQLAAGTTPLAGTELVPIVQSGVTSRTTVQAIMTSTVPSGTANGVLYLNGSKVATSGSALVFDGSNLGLGVTPSAWGGTRRALQVVNASFWGDTGLSSFASVGSNYAVNAGGQYFYINSTSAADYYQLNGAHIWRTSPSGTAGNTISFTQAMTLDASGNLMVGTTGAVGRFTLENAATTTEITLRSTGGIGINNRARIIGGYESGGSDYGGYLAFNTTSSSNVNTERARITSGGDFLVGSTGGGLQNSYSTNFTQASGYWTVNHANGSPDTRRYFYFGYNGSEIGSITQSGTTAVAYNTSSDYRLKDNPQPLTGSGAFIDALQPKTWDWKADGSRGVGFIAHEVQAVSPRSVVGEKDAVDADGKPVMQAMEYGSAEFIANIIAELQSLRARVAALEGV